MAVARSYEKFQQMGEPFESEGKMYVRVKGNCPRCGGSGHYSYNQMDGTRCYGCNGSGVQVLKVRWYTDSQRESMDRAAEKRAVKAAEKKEERRIRWSDRNKFGFGEAGFITLYKGNMDIISDYFKSFTVDEAGHRAAWYSPIFHWYTPSNMSVPTDLPEGVETVRLEWDAVRDESDEENLRMVETKDLESIITKLICEPSPSRYQGKIGEWLECEVTVQKNIALYGGYYSASNMYILTDGTNIYVWTTSKQLEEGATFNLRMKVKDHREYKGEQQTVVYYCRIK